MLKKAFALFAIAVMLVLVAACAATPEPERIVETVIVTKEVKGETIVETVEVVKEVEVTKAPEEEQIVLRFANWATAEEATRNIFLKAIDEFKATHPNVEIELIALPFDQVRPQLITMSAGGNPPDIVQLNGAWPHELGAMGVLRDLRELASDEYLADNYVGGLDAGVYNDTLYAVPIGLTPHGLWWNKKLFEQAGLDPDKPPKTMDELNDVMATLKANLPEDVYPIGIDTTKIDYALTGFWPWMLTEGARPLYAGQYDFTDPATVKAFDWLKMTVDNGYTPVGLQIKEERELMAKGKIAMKLDGPYVSGIMRSLNPEFEGDALYETFGVTSVPVGDNGEPVTLADLHQIGISTQCKYPELAWEFVVFFNTNQVALEEYTMTSGLVPALKSEIANYNDTPYLANPISQAFINEVIPSMIGGPYDATYGAASQFVIQGMQEVAIQGTPVETALEDVTSNIKILYNVE
jgi:multiple sugar transport system substrate-binding protein